jgi:hypothetical protein
MGRAHISVRPRGKPEQCLRPRVERSEGPIHLGRRDGGLGGGSVQRPPAKRGKSESSAELACKPDSVPPLRDWTIIPLGPRLLAASCNQPGGLSDGPSPRIAPLFDLAPCGVFPVPRMSPPRRCALTAPFHPYPGCLATSEAVSLSVALSLRSPPLAVNQHTALAVNEDRPGVRTFLSDVTPSKRPSSRLRRAEVEPKRPRLSTSSRRSLP